jgi:type IV pilus assembly protein PilQ
MLADFPGSAAETPAATSGVRLTAISSRVGSSGASLVIEASEPVPYMSTRPDPLTVVLDFRNVGMDGVAPAIKPNPRSPISSVAVEPVEILGARVTRVRVSLAQPVGHKVRSDKNNVVVDFDRVTAAAIANQTPAATTPAARPADTSGTTPDALLALENASVNAESLSAPHGAVAANVLAAKQTAQTATPSAAPVRIEATGATAQQTRALAAQATQPAPSAPQTTAQSGQERRYVGHPVSMQFEGLDLRAVLRLFAEISGLNIVIDPTVQGSVDVALTEVPWDQALDIILKANKLGYIVDGTIVRIAPLTVLADEAAQSRKLDEERALAGELRVLTRTLSYARAESLQQLLTRSALSSRGSVQVDPRTNTLIITDLQPRLQVADDLLSSLDRAEPQVEIEARIVQTNKNFVRRLGVQWGLSGRIDPALGNTTNLAFPNSGVLGGRIGTLSQGPNGVPTAVNLPAATPSSGVGLTLGSVNGAFNLDVALTAMQAQGDGRILSTPRVSTLNNVEAEMTQGVQIPIQVVSNNTVTVSFRDAALQLRVTPQITAAGTVIMRVSLENSTPDFSREVNGIPPINTQRANTTLLVSDGETTVIGGIYTSNQQTNKDSTPGLGQIPLLSWLFKRESLVDDSTELLIFITPRIIKV